MEASRYFSKDTLARGKVLVATDKVRDGHFARTVILITEYGWRGAAGIIINKPTKIAPSAVLPDMKGLGDVDDVVWFGGPVGSAQVTMLVRSKEAPPSSLRLLADVYASTSVETLSAMIAGREAGRFRLYSGYAGWAPQQLELEVAEGGWYVMDAGSAEVFEDADAAEGVWARLIGRARGR
jgi:putative transcriptional regulator